MKFENILFEVEQGIATITLNRPEVNNSINIQTIDEMVRTIDFCASSRDVRVVVLTGAGDFFSAGEDIEIMNMAQDLPDAEVAEVIETQGHPRFIRKVMSLPKPVIACVNGMCFGAGAEIAMACDFIIASNRASFGQPYVNVGLMGNTYLLSRLVGPRKALELIWTGKTISAEEAYQLGIVNLVVVAGSLVENTYKLARKFGKGPTKAMGMAKKAVYESLHMDLKNGLKLMCQLQGELIKSKDHQEGAAAFLERRKPHFSGE